MPEPGERLDRAADGMPYKPEARALKPYDIEIDPSWNGRDMSSAETNTHIEELMESIRARINSDPPLPALIYPVKIKYDRATGKAKLIAGECRLTACRRLWDEGEMIYVPAQVQEGTDVQQLLASVTENSGQPLTQWENGKTFRKLHIGCGLSIEAIASHACRSKRYVTDAIALANVPEEAKELLSAGTATPGAVLHAVRGTEGDSVASLKERVASKPKSEVVLHGVKDVKPTPVKRPKKQSDGEKMLSVGDKLAAKCLEGQPDWDIIERLAKQWQKGRA